MTWLEYATIVVCAVSAGIAIWTVGVVFFGSPYQTGGLFGGTDAMREEMRAFHAAAPSAAERVPALRPTGRAYDLEQP